MDNSDNSTKAKSKKERASNTSVTTNESPFVSPVASPIIEPNNETVKIPIVDNLLNNYKLPISQKNDKESKETTVKIENKLQNSENIKA